MPLLVHGETADPDVDVFDRETHFIDAVLGPLTERFDGLRVVFEHITTAGAVDFVTRARTELRPPSRRSICCITGTPFSPAESGRTITVCRC